MRAFSIASVLAVGIAAATTGQPEEGGLAVLYVGQDEKTERHEAFGEFLRGRFETVSITTHGDLSDEAVAAADVVLLDWQQGGDDFPPKSCPLGERDAWDKPTVLLGSAGLYVACAWEVFGGSG